MTLFDTMEQHNANFHRRIGNILTAIKRTNNSTYFFTKIGVFMF